MKHLVFSFIISLSVSSAALAAEASRLQSEAMRYLDSSEGKAIKAHPEASLLQGLATFQILDLAATGDLTEQSVRDKMVELAGRIPLEEEKATFSNGLLVDKEMPNFPNFAKYAATSWLKRAEDAELYDRMLAAYLKGSSVELILAHKGRFTALINDFVEVVLPQAEHNLEFQRTALNLFSKLKTVRASFPKHLNVVRHAAGTAIWFSHDGARKTIDQWTNKIAQQPMRAPRCSVIVGD